MDMTFSPASRPESRACFCVCNRGQLLMYVHAPRTSTDREILYKALVEFDKQPLVYTHGDMEPYQFRGLLLGAYVRR